MKKILLLAILAIAITSCGSENKVEGNFGNNENDGNTIVLYETNHFDKEFKAVDSVVIANGEFLIKRQSTDKPTSAYLLIKDHNGNIAPMIPFANENGTVTIKIGKYPIVGGTPTNEIYQKYVDGMLNLDKEMYALATSEDPSLGEIRRINQEASKLTYSFLESTIKTPFGEFMLTSNGSYLNSNQLADLVSEASEDLQNKFKDIVSNTTSSKEEKEEAKSTKKQYIDISGENPEGKKIALSDYVGKNKLVLIDFWASWCAPCIQEMPNLVKAYDEYKDKGFEIVGVSLDEKKESWTGAINRLNMTWPQMSDLKGWESELSIPYEIKAIPYTLLVNDKGEIIAKDLRGDELYSLLSELLK